MKNYWVSDKNFLAHWNARFPLPKSKADLEWVFQFGAEVLAAGEEDDFFRILETDGVHGYNAAVHGDYIEYLKQIGEQTGVIPFMKIGGLPKWKGGGMRVPVSVCYYDKGGHLQKAAVENLGALLSELRPDDIEEYSYRCMNANIPIEINGTKIVLDELNDGQSRTFHLSVSLYTDIWFPWVVGDMEEFPADNALRLYDNRELAQCHTPLLNRFLVRLHQLTEKYGGEWEFWCNPFYEKWVTETDIKLDE